MLKQISAFVFYVQAHKTSNAFYCFARIQVNLEQISVIYNENIASKTVTCVVVAEMLDKTWVEKDMKTGL